MRILYLLSFPRDGQNLGGIESYGRELSSAIESRGHDVERIHLYGPDIMRSLSATDRIPRPPWLARYYWWRGVPIQDYRYHNAVRRLSHNTIRRFSPDIIHCTHCYLAGGVAGIDVPYVASCLGLEVVDAPPIRQLLTNAAVIHSISDFTRRRAEGVVKNGRHRVLSWGITARPCANNEAKPTYDLITVGRVVRRKNIETVIRALKTAPHIRYAVVGDGPELDRLKAIVAENGMTNVDFLGAVSEDEKHQLLCRSRVFIMCPRNDNDDVEGLGVVYFEAHGAGLPAIAARSGGAPEAVGRGGIIVDDPLSEVEIRHAIDTALEPEVYARLRAAVQERQQTHSWNRFISAFEQLYSDAQEAAPARRIS